jgi:hypothetical protein
MKQIAGVLAVFLSVIMLVHFRSTPHTQSKAVLLADREAPLGWIYLRIYHDSTFEFESRGIERKGNIYRGVARIKSDTIFFNYIDSVPKAGETAIYNSSKIAYIDGSYPESLTITLNELKK